MTRLLLAFLIASAVLALGLGHLGGELMRLVAR